MPVRNFYILLFSILVYGLCSRFTLRDRILVESLHRIENDALTAPTAKQLYEGAMNGMTEVLYGQHDEYSAFIPDADEKQYNDEMENRFDGIGVVYEQEPGSTASGSVNIIYPVLGSPAARAGIRSGDKVVQVNGTEIKDLALADVSKLFAGTLGGKVSLTVVPFGKTEPQEFSIPRVPVQRESVEGDRIDADGKRVFFLETLPDIAYIRLTSFTPYSALEMENALRQIAEKKETRGLILDLRGNPGGYVSECIQIANLFLGTTKNGKEKGVENNVIVSTRYRSGKTRETYYIESAEPLCKLPLAVLIDGGSASASEILSAALQDHKRAVLAGSRTFGKGCMQKIIPLPVRSGTLSLTDVSYYRPSGQNIHRTADSAAWGVQPDVQGLPELSEEQQFATEQIRNRRSNTISEFAPQVLDNYIKRISDDMERFLSETHKQKPNISGGTDSPFVLQGQSPYFDPVLDKAAEIFNESGEK
ncbi:MAG: S41 family peptidase [Planctomycetaceae bacterium]|jgi:carboxyl-terminal processing protease|nr:S41 family peptidase [Planctomycetaceae bacterium]